MTWEYITIAAALGAGIGFIVQFIGLRGLTYPCSIAQLVAILLMAFVRALIRRRLGQEPSYCPTFARFEMDFLATRIVHDEAFREFKISLEDEISLLNQESMKKLLSWRVKTANGNNKEPFFSKTLEDLKEDRTAKEADEPEINQTIPSNHSQKIRSSEPSPIKTASSQQLLRVRERLGDLCEWRTEALESARSLVYSVEAFMDSFFPNTAKSFDWVIETNDRGELNCISIPVQQDSEGKWRVRIGTIEAIISLWMASIEAEAADERKNSDEGNANKTSGHESEAYDWRRTKLGGDLRYAFCRILGDDFNDGTLKRDLSWWVSETIFGGDEDKELSKKGGIEDTIKEDGISQPAGSGNIRKEAKAVDLVIGFNGLTSRCRFSAPTLYHYVWN